MTDEEHPNTNYDDEYYNYVDGLSTYAQHTFMDADLSSLDEYEFVSAILSLKPGSQSGSENDVDYSIITSSWTETGITWNNEPSYSIIPLGSISFDSTGTAPRSEINATDYVFQVISEAASYYGYAFFDTTIVAGSTNYQKIMSTDSVSQYYPYFEVTTFGDEHYYVEDSISVPLTGAYGGGGRAYFDMQSYNVGNNEVFVDHRCPWSDTFEGAQTWSVDENHQYSTPISGGTEYYDVTFTGLYWNGEIYQAGFDVIWWRDWGKRYVSPYGSNTNHAFVMDDPWETITYAATNCPANKDLHIKYGAYPSETKIAPDNSGIKYVLDNWNPAGGYNTNQKAFIGLNNFGRIGDMGVGDGIGASTINGKTIIQPNATASKTGTIDTVWIAAYNSYGDTFKCKIKVFREDGSYYDHISTSNEYELSNGYNELDVNISVTAGDILGLYTTATDQNVLIYRGNDATISTPPVTQSGDINTDTLKTAWTSFANDHICLYGRIP